MTALWSATDSKAFKKKSMKDYIDYIPSAKAISETLIIISLLALGVLCFFCSCKTNAVSETVRDTLFIVKRDTVKDVRYVKDVETEKQYQSIIERLEKESSDLRTIVLSASGDTIKEYHEKIIQVNNSKDSTNAVESYREIRDSVNKYLTRLEAIYKAMNSAKEIKEEPSWFDKLKSNIFYMVLGVVLLILTVFGIKKFIIK